MLIGREHEQQVIDRLVAGARVGGSGVLALTGEPGVGKSALLRWSAARHEGFRVLRATGTEPEREVPFAGLLSVLRPALPLLERLPAPQARALAAALALEEGGPADRFAIGAATLSLVCRYAEDAPVLVVLDDLHLIDRPSVAALLFAARRLASDPVAVLMAARPGEVEDLLDGVQRLVVRGLDLAAARTLVEGASGAPVTDGRLARLHRLTGGNPLAMAELAGDPDALLPSGSDVPVPLSTALTASFSRRLQELAPDARSVLLVAVVCNGDLRLTGEVCAGLGLELDLLGAIEPAGLADVVGGEVVFRHPLLRAAVYGDSLPAERRTVHATVAAALPEEDADRRAWHLSESLWAPDPEVAALLDAAAERAQGRAAHAVASAGFERAARLSPGGHDATLRLLRAARSAWAAGLGPRAVALLDELDPVADQHVALQALELRAVVAARSGSLRTGCDLLERAAAAATSGDQRALLLAQALQAAFLLADGATAARLAEELEDAVGATTTARARAVGTLATGMAKVLAGRSGIEELRAAVPMLAALSEPPSDGRVVSWLMYAPLFIRDAGTGRDLRDRVDEARDRAGVADLPGLLFLVARDAATTDTWPRAAADYTEAVRLARDTGQTTELAMSLAGLAWLQSRTGHEADCRRHATEALSLGRDRDIHTAEAWALFALGELALVKGDADAAVSHLQELDELLARLEVRDADLSPRPELVEALVRLGRLEEAARLAAEFLAAAEAKGQPWARARARRAVGLAATAHRDDSFRDDSFRAALALHEQTPDSFEAARTELAYGEVLRRDARRVEAREHLRPALAAFTDLGAEPWADRAATELDLTGERVQRRPLGGVAALTPQELQVALLLAGGRTTREAAAALFLSPKTVEYHLRKIYTKLGIRSRDELSTAVTPGTGPDRGP